MNLGKILQRMGPRVLPFADASSHDLPFRRLARLGLFQVSVGLTLALMAGTLNRVMIVEMAIGAAIVATFLAIPMVSSPLRALFGHKSDHHRSSFGWRRVPYLWFGTFTQFMGLALIPFSLIILDQTRGYSESAQLVGLLIGGLGFVLVGLGAHAVQTAGLALATDLAPVDRRPRVVAFLYVMFLVGLLIGGLCYSWMLRDFTAMALIRVVKGSAVLILILNTVAVWKQEAWDPERAAHRDEPPPRFRDSWARLVAQPGARRLLWAVGLGAGGFAMQDVLLEPYGGEIMSLAVGQTSLLTALSALGALLAFGAAARWLPRGVPALVLAGWGITSGILAFALVIAAPVVDAPLVLYAGAALIGFGGGLFTVGTLTAAMRLDQVVGSGMAVGAWGAVYASAGGLALGVGGVIRDLVIRYWGSGSLAPGVGADAAGYLLVYHLEVLVLFTALGAIGPLVLRWESVNTDPHLERPLGLAELPG